MRRSPGFSLITVAALGAVSMMWLLAMTAAVVPMYQRASTGRYFTVVRSSAEAGLDYAVAMLNQSLQTGTPSPIDDQSEDGSPAINQVPANAVGNSGAQVTIQVNNVRPSATSSIYDAQWDQPTNHWRLVTATASYAGLQKSIRVILKPEAGTPTSISTPVPYFQFAMFGKSFINMGGNAQTDGYDSRNGDYDPADNKDNYAGDVGSNKSAQFGGNANIGGDVRIYSQPKGSSTAVVARAVSTNVVIRDQLVINGVSSGFTATVGPAAMPGDNVLAQGQGMPPRTGDWETPIDASQSYDPIEVPPAKTVPPDAQVVTGSVSWTNGTTGWVSQPTAGKVADLGSVSVTGNKVLNIRPGDYKISSLMVGGNGKINVLPNADGSTGQVRFFVEGIAPGENVIQIAGNGIVNQSAKPGNLQMWYNGSKNILLAGNGNLHAVIYAPNSYVKVTGNGNYFGAIMGDTVENQGNGQVHFDKALLATSGTTAIAFNKNQTQMAPSALKTRSWQEL
ncbi:MAG TPA: hypothetical protein V6D08_09810 [Candidatus Obscuribacterales bacterium]